MLCTASRWPCSTSSIASSSFRAAPISAHLRRCSPATARNRRAAPWSGCWRWLMSAPVRPNSPRLSMPNSMPAGCPISMGSLDASRLILPMFRTSPSNWCRFISMTSSALFGRAVQHEERQCHRHRPRRTASGRTAAACNQIGVARYRRPGRQGGLAGGAVSGRPGRARDGRTRSPPHRTPSCRSPVAARQDARQFRLRCRPRGQQGPGDGTGRRRQLARKGSNLIMFGPPGGGKSHLAAALGFALVENGWRVLFTRTTDLVQRLQIARRELALESAIAKLDKYHLLILDDLAYVTKDQAETSVLFELIGARYERRSLLVTANQPFGEWGKIFPDQAMTLAVIDRLVHHATIFEMNVESYRRRAALERKRGRGRPPAHATLNTAT